MIRLGMLFMVLVLAGPARAADPAAFVAKYLPPKGQHIVVRSDGEEGTVGLGTSLYAGDKLVVKAGGSLVVAYADGEKEELKGPTTFAIPEKEPMGTTARILGRMQNLLGRKYRQGSNLATRNPGSCPSDGLPASALQAPVLAPVTRLAAGHENLSLAWMGGCPPYRLSMAAATPAVQEDLKRPLARLQTGKLEPGTYALTIADAQSQEIAVEVVVVSTAPNGPLESPPSSELEAVAHAGWLANHEEGAWRLESFQQLRPWIRQGSTLAGTYGDLVMWGDPNLDDDAD